VPWPVWWSFLRTASHPRVFPVPTPLPDCFAFVDALRAQPGHLDLDAGPTHLDCIREVCTAGEVSADLLPDAVLAAIATEHGCQVVSFDRDFARFPGPRWVPPEAEP
jgi:toxin-antitoxin system PIN domain toxin